MVDDVVLFRSQAALKMLREAVGGCLDWLWANPSDRSRFWAVAYHGVFRADLHSSPSQEALKSWEIRVQGHPAFGGDPLGDRTKWRP